MENTTSPTPQQTGAKSPTATMNFPQAMEKVIEGKKIHKIEWKDKEFYGFLNGEFLSLHKPDGRNYKWIISDGDLNGDDYIVL